MYKTEEDCAEKLSIYLFSLESTREKKKRKMVDIYLQRYSINQHL